MPDDNDAPLTDDELYADAVGSYYDACSAIGEDVRAGRRELPAMFRSRFQVWWLGEAWAVLDSIAADPMAPVDEKDYAFRRSAQRAANRMNKRAAMFRPRF